MNARRRVLRPAIGAGLVLAVIAGFGLSASPPGSGGRAANAAEARAITTAYRSSPLGDVNQVPRANYRIVGIRVSRLAPTWATARQVPTAAGEATFQPAYGVLVRLARTRGAPGPWVLVDVGSSEVGCKVAPRRVLTDLRLGCPDGTGL